MKNKSFLSSKKTLLLGMCAVLVALLIVGCSNKNKDNIVGKNVISGTCGQNLTWTLDTLTGKFTISGTGAMADYYYDGDVQAIPSPWNQYTAQIKQVQIGNSVTSIGDYAFYSCTNLTSVTISNSVIAIGQFAFTDCLNLTSITIPNSVTSIGSAVFAGCGLASITLPNSITIISDNAFAYCAGLTSVVISSGVTNIRDNAFYNCSNLTSVTCLNPTPPFADTNPFYGINTYCALYVPSASVALYQQAPVWNSFTNIAGM
jgi:hypothetical protein